MRLTFVTLIALLILSGCHTPQARHPINPEALGIFPKLEKTPAEDLRLEQDTLAAFIALFGEPLSPQFRLEQPVVGWFNEIGELKQLRASAKIPRAEFHTRTTTKSWREIPLPPEYLKAMHLSPDVPKSYMTCFVGSLKGQPAYLFWNDYAETIMLILDY
ncbi:MAG TPA: hypothetical protein VGH19_08940 [Verrucomicrobiae bacterium]